MKQLFVDIADGTFPKLPKLHQLPLSPKYPLQSNQNRRNPKVILFAIGGVIVISVLCCISAGIYSATPQGKANATRDAQTKTAAPTKTAIPTRTLAPTKTAIPTKTATATATPIIDNSVKAIMDDAGLSQQEAEAAFVILKSVGFNDVDQLTLTSGTGNEREYQVSGNCDWLVCNSVYFVLFTDNKITYIGRGDITLYDIDLGGVLDNIANYTLTDDDKYNFEAATQTNVESVLKAPSTADFVEDKWVVVRKKDLVEVWGSVDAENSFGAKLRNDFYAQWSFNTGKALYLNLAGTIIYGSLQKP